MNELCHIDSDNRTTFHLRAPWRNLPCDRNNWIELDTGSGRGRIALIDHPDGLVAARPYRHGGLRRLFAPELFLKGDRAQLEFLFHWKVYEAGIPTTEPVGWWESTASAPGFRRYGYLTKYIPDAKPLPVSLSDPNLRRSAPEKIASILADLHRLEIFHADLNLNNWLAADGQLFLIDFDKAFSTTGDSENYLLKCLRRMLRSGLKLGFTEPAWKLTFLRLLVSGAAAFQVSARRIFERIPASDFELNRLKTRLWRVTGGHRGSNK